MKAFLTSFGKLFLAFSFLAVTQKAYTQNSFPTPTGAATLDARGGGADKGGELRLSELDANGANYVGLRAPDVLGGNQIYVFPNGFPAGSGRVLSSDNAGVLTWVKRAKPDLSNLEGPTAINQSLIPGVTNSLDLGSEDFYWRDVYMTGNFYQLGLRVIAFEDGANTFVGVSTGLSNTTGFDNAFFGQNAGYFNTTGTDNSFFGTNTGFFNSQGSGNSFFGEDAGSSNTTGSENTFMGEDAGYSNTIGSENTFIGGDAGSANTTGNYNSFFGGNSGLFNTIGASNAFFGADAGAANTTGSGNLFMGVDAGDLVTTGGSNTSLSYLSDINTSSLTNATAIGYNAGATASNQVRIGDVNVTSIGGYANWSDVSDGRFKKNVKENVPGIDFINKLKPVTYNLDAGGIKRFITSMNDEENPDLKAQEEKEKIIHSGFIAQDVEKAAQELGYDFSGVDAPKNENDLYGLRYAEFVVPLVKAVQELDQNDDVMISRLADVQMENEILKSKNEILENKNEELEARLEKLESAIQNPQSAMDDGFGKLSTDNQQPATPLLGQNIPNPLHNSTVIPFRIPQNCTEASIMIMETATGRVVEVIPVTCDETHVTINAATLAGGSYTYTLYVDGRIIDTKKMELIK